VFPVPKKKADELRGLRRIGKDSKGEKFSEGQGYIRQIETLLPPKKRGEKIKKKGKHPACERKESGPKGPWVATDKKKKPRSFQNEENLTLNLKERRKRKRSTESGNPTLEKKSRKKLQRGTTQL